MTSGAKATPFVQGSPEWLEARLAGIGSSDAAVIAGERGSVLELWAIKLRRIEAPEPDPELARLFEWGHRLEPVVADWYSDTTGRPLRRVNRMLVHPTIPWALASLDRVSAVKGERRIVEIKTSRFGWSSDEPVPGAVQAQVQHQLAVTGYDAADVVSLTGGSEPRIVEIERDEVFIADLLALEADFWAHVQAGTPPEADGSENARRAISRMYPADDGTIVAPTPDLVELVERLRDARIRKREADAEEASIANGLRLLLGAASGIAGLLTLRKSADVTRRNWPAIAGDYRQALEDLHVTRTSLNAIEAGHSSTSEGPRVLRLLKEEIR